MATTCNGCVYKKTSAYSKSCSKSQSSFSSDTACTYYKSYLNMYCKDCIHQKTEWFAPPGVPPYTCKVKFFAMALMYQQACDKFEPKY